jgi:pilus assembly protein Flp/PilA
MGAAARSHRRSAILSHAGGRFAAAAHAARSVVKAFAADKRGATAIEYALIAGLVSIIIVGAVTNMGSAVNSLFARVVTGFQ